MKQIIITVPDNCELKQDGNTYTIIEKEKKLTYESIRDKELSKQFYIRNDIQCTSSKQYQKLLAINKLMNLAKWLNDGWQPDWNNEEEGKYYIYINNVINELCIECTGSFNCSVVCFKSEDLAKQAIEILGEETIRLALCTDY